MPKSRFRKSQRARNQLIGSEFKMEEIRRKVEALQDEKGSFEDVDNRVLSNYGLQGCRSYHFFLHWVSETFQRQMQMSDLVVKMLSQHVCCATLESIRNNRTRFCPGQGTSLSAVHCREGDTSVGGGWQVRGLGNKKKQPRSNQGGGGDKSDENGDMSVWGVGWHLPGRGGLYLWVGSIGGEVTSRGGGGKVKVSSSLNHGLL